MSCTGAATTRARLPDLANQQYIDLGYRPRVHQTYLHQNLKRFNVIVAHRRFGKTVFCIHETIDRLLRLDRKNPQGAYISPTYGQSKRVAWEYLKDAALRIPGAVPNESDLRVDIPRAHRGDHVRIMLLGAENPGTIRGIYLDGVILDEFAECDPTVWSQVVRPALSDRLGWAIFIGTPKGQNHFYDIHQTARRLKDKDWFSVTFKAGETRIIPDSELEAARATMTVEEYEQEYECSFSAAMIGAYFSKEMNKADADKRILTVPHDPAFGVVTAWDLGISDTTSIWFAQQVGREVHLIDYVESSGVGLDWYVKEIKNKTYIYNEHLLPHDAGARELGSGKTRQETMREYGLGRTRILPRQDLMDGIHAARMLIAKSWFDAAKCERGINALRNYTQKWDEKNKVFSKNPLHNWASHGADAFRCLALGFRGDEFTYREKDLPRQADMHYDIFNPERE